MRLHSLALASFLTVSAAAAVALPAYAASEDAMGEQTGTVVLTAKSADVGVGYTWGEGTLHFKGKVYHFTISGGQIAAVGFSKYESRGVVYNLHKVSDFSGTFATLSGEATLVKGVGGSVLENSNGVRLKLETAANGARLAASGQGLSIKLKE
ncbi:hypothetical protein LOC54_02860 [Acetobacter sp. AN02]|uniref:hypothetical protein n=1 Tax=Acetobacter sp. AN02 TaxID=2894186 RepID=UPI0024342334|nr:hypothetical protein [Acetobacter sp. AN02]MDG6094064.1 hypothetical protein [Acetobacter sp. AN02]